MKTTKKHFSVTLPVLDTAALKGTAQRVTLNIQRALHVGPFSTRAKLEQVAARLMETEKKLEEGNFLEAGDYDLDDFVTEQQLEKEIQDAFDGYEPDLSYIRDFQELEERVDDLEQKDVDELLDRSDAFNKVKDAIEEMQEPEAFDRGVAEATAVKALQTENTALKAILYRLVSVSSLPEEVRSEAMGYLGNGNYPEKA